jgi:hypothetical protein
MNSFTFGLWTGVVAGVVLAALMKQSRHEPSMEEKLLGPHAARIMAPPSAVPDSAPNNLADALAQRSEIQA